MCSTNMRLGFLNIVCAVAIASGGVRRQLWWRGVRREVTWSIRFFCDVCWYNNIM